MSLDAPSSGSFERAEASSSDRNALYVIAGFLVARLVFALALGFGVDESYTLALSRKLSLSYFDHPPLHQWIAHCAALAFGETLAVRLPFVALFAGTGWLLYRLTLETFGRRAALIALFALNATPFFFASPGAWVVPDGPLLFALALAALSVARLAFRPGLSEGAIWRGWLVVGVALGLAGLSKYSAVFAAAGIAAFVLIAPAQRRWLRHPAPYVAAGVAAAMMAPVLAWNAEHGWVSFAFQGARGAPGAAWRPAQVGAMALGEIAYLTPWFALALIAGLTAAWRERRDARRLLLLALALPAILAFTATPLWGARGFPHWPMPGWFFAYPLLGAWLDRRWSGEGVLRRPALAAIFALVAIAAVAVGEAQTGWAMRFAPVGARLRDPLLESFDWQALGAAPLLDPPPAFVASTKWSDAGKIALALGPTVPVLTFSDDPRGMAFLYDGADLLGRDGVLVAPVDGLEAALLTVRPFVERLGPPQPFALGREGRVEIVLALVPMRRLTHPPPMPYPGANRR